MPAFLAWVIAVLLWVVAGVVYAIAREMADSDRASFAVLVAIVFMGLCLPVTGLPWQITSWGVFGVIGLVGIAAIVGGLQGYERMAAYAGTLIFGLVGLAVWFRLASPGQSFLPTA